MADATPNRPGQVQNSGDELALFLKTFGGEVLTAYEDNNVTQGKVMEKMIQSGKSATFPATGKVGSGYHTPGTEITGRSMEHNEAVISIDGLLITDIFEPEIDELMNHYETRSIYSNEMGREMARQYDINNFRSIIQSARQSALVAGQNGGSSIALNNITTDGAVIKNAIWDAAQALDEKNAPPERYASFAPAQYYLLAEQKDVLNQDWGGRGSYAEANVPVVADVGIVKCNHIPNTDLSADSTVKAKYQADYSQVRGVVWTNRASGVVKLKDLAMESEYDIRRQGTLLIAKYAVGHGPVRPDNAVELLETV